MEKQASQVSSSISQILNQEEKCFVCKGLEEPSIVILSNLPKEKNFVQLICSQCLMAQQSNQKNNSLNEITFQVKDQDDKTDLLFQNGQSHQEEKKVSQSQETQLLFKETSKEKNQSLVSELNRDSLTQNEKEEQKMLSQISQKISQLQTCDNSLLINDKDLLNDQIKDQQIQNHFLLQQNQSQIQNESNAKKQSQVSQDQDQNDEEKKILELQNLEKQKSREVKPAFLIQPHHFQIQIDQLISQFESSLKTQKLQLLQQSTDLQQFIKSSLRVIYDIQSEVENMHSSINEVSSKPEDLVYQLKEINFSKDKQSLLEQLIQYIDLNQENVEAKLKQFKFQEKIDDIQTKLEYLSESLQPNLFELNSQIYKIKKETVQYCNHLLSQIKIQGKWKSYTDIQMDEEIMHPGMRGVYRFRISQNGRISNGTNTGYVYLAQDTTEEYTKYNFQNLIQSQKGLFQSYNNCSKHPIANKLAEYFLEQRNQIQQLENKISQCINSLLFQSKSIIKTVYFCFSFEVFKNKFCKLN
ncbi:hypothetical protein ABPG74_008699 [Tetrahymena malaccensis]